MVQSEGLLRHNVVEVLPGDLLVVGGCPLQHLNELILAHGLAQLLGHPLDVINVDVAGSVVVEQVEDLVDAVLRSVGLYLGLLVTQLGGDGVQELLEIDLAALALKVGDHVEDGGVL